MNRKSKPYEPKGFSGDEVEVLFLEIAVKNSWSTEIMAANNVFMSLLEERGGITAATYSLVTHVTGTLEFPVDTSYIEGLNPGGKYREELYQILKKTNPKIVAMSLMTPMYNRGVMIAHAIKEYDQDIKVVVGGIHPTVFPEETSKDGFDHVFVRDGFQTLAPTIENILLGRETSKIIKSPKPFIDNPDSNLPFSHPHAYKNRKFMSFGFSKAIIYASYGCDSACKFCAGSAVYGNRRKTHDPGRIVDEMEWQINKYSDDYLREDGNCFFLFGDATAVQDAEDDLERMLTILYKIEERDLKVLMDFSMRADIIREIYAKSPEKLEKLYRYNVGAGFGVESLRNSTLKKYKSESLNDVTDAIKAINAINKLPLMFFIIGYEQDTRETIIEDMKMLREIAGEYAIIPTFILTPDPGSSLYYDFERKGKIKNKNWDYYNHRKLVWDHPYFEPDELEALYYDVREEYAMPKWTRDLREEFKDI